MNLAEYTWHALLCQPQSELDVNHKLWSRWGIPAIVPAEKQWKERRGHTVETRRPVMPMYVFAGFSQIPDWEILRTAIPAIYGYMQFGDGPTKIRQKDVQWLYDLRETLAGRQRPVEEVIKIGDTVRVIHGSLEGMSVMVDKIVAARIHTIKSFLGAPRVFKIPLAHVQRI